MDIIKLDHVFNFIPNTIRDQVSDDDQIRSWAMQAATSLNFKHLQYVRDIIFLTVENHQAVMPDDMKKILKIHAYQGSTLSESDVDVLYNCCDTSTFELYPDGMTFAEACPIYHRVYVASTFFQNNWEAVERVQNLADDYFCNVDNAGCNEVYSYNSSDRIAQFSFKTGLIAVTYYGLAQDSDGDVLMPEEPQDLWNYMSAYIVTKFLEDQELMGKPNVASMLDRWRDRETKFRNSLRAKWNLMSLRGSNIQSIISTRFLRNSQILLEYVSNAH